jgi:hypothetical protein
LTDTFAVSVEDISAQDSELLQKNPGSIIESIQEGFVPITCQEETPKSFIDSNTSPLKFGRELQDESKPVRLEVPKMGSFKASKKVSILMNDCSPIEERNIEESPQLRKKKIKLIAITQPPKLAVKDVEE